MTPPVAPTGSESLDDPFDELLVAINDPAIVDLHARDIERFFAADLNAMEAAYPERQIGNHDVIG